MSTQPSSQQRWISTAEFLAITGMPMRTFRHKVKRGEVIARKPGKNLEISAASLPDAALRKMEPAAPVKKSTLRADASQAPPVTAPLFAATTVESQTPGRRILLPEGQERQAAARLAILQPLLDYCSSTEVRARCAALKLADGRSVANSNDMAQYIAETHAGECSAGTLWTWKRRYLQLGLPGLARKVREDKGRARWAEQYPQAAKLAVATYLQPWQTKMTAYDALRRELTQFGMRTADLPSYGAVCAYLNSLPAAPVVWAREGERAHDAKFATYLRRDYNDIAPYQVVVSDHMIHDCEVRNDCFVGVEDNAPMRLRLTLLMDLRSRKALAMTWTPEGSSRSISTAIASMVREFGVPKIFYCDNGKDYQKVGRGAARANPGNFRRPDNLAQLVEDDMDAMERAGVLRQLGIQVQYCIKYHPQSKPIERMFRTLHLGLDAVLPHYTTGNSYTRPEATDRAGAEHRKLLRMDRAHLSPLLPASTFIAMAKTWIEQDYNAGHVIQGRGMDGLTPNECFARGYDPAQKRLADPGVLDMLLWQRERRLVRNCAVTISNRRLIGATPRDAEALYRLSEDAREIVVCFDPNAPEIAVAADSDGHKLCDLRAENFAPHSIEATPMIAAEISGRRGRRNDMVASIRSLRKDVTAAGHKTAAQDLYERSQQHVPLTLPMAVGDHITQRVVPAARATEAPRYAHEVAEDILRED